MKNILILVFASLLFTACEKIVDVDIPSGESRLVVEGLISTVNEPWMVKLSLSQPYLDQSELSTIESAAVSIVGTDGSDVLLNHTDTGTFVSADPQRCIIGEEYTLKIVYDGEEYTASGTVPNAFPIDTIASYYLPDNNGFIPAGYYVFIQGKENVATGDYYLFKPYLNDSMMGAEIDNDEFGSVSYLNEDFDSEKILEELALGKTPRPFPFTVEPGDTVRVEQFAISREYYQFIIDRNAQLNRGGTPFDAPPANPNYNISNGALGYFSVAYKDEATVVIEE
ncbi:MAG: DUF4249 domain-containing protein [Bacteroidia bacterium]